MVKNNDWILVYYQDLVIPSNTYGDYIYRGEFLEQYKMSNFMRMKDWENCHQLSCCSSADDSKTRQGLEFETEYWKLFMVKSSS